MRCNIARDKNGSSLYREIFDIFKPRIFVHFSSLASLVLYIYFSLPRCFLFTTILLLLRNQNTQLNMRLYCFLRDKKREVGMIRASNDRITMIRG